MSDEEVDELLKAVDTSSGEINYTGMFAPDPGLITPLGIKTHRIYANCGDRSCSNDPCKLNNHLQDDKRLVLEYSSMYDIQTYIHGMDMAVIRERMAFMICYGLVGCMEFVSS